MEDRTKGQELQEKLTFNIKNAWENSSEEHSKSAFEFCEDYKSFLDKAKTERLFVSEVEKLARKNGFVSIDEVIDSSNKIVPGMKLYQISKGKSIILSVIGSKPVAQGVNLIGSHIDSPRLDLKQNPVYEDSGTVLLKTHYYGGFKKYQWVTIPLSIHGVVIKGDGTTENISIGEDERDPVFTITDLLPHLAQEQIQKKASEVITAEGMNVLFGSIPYNDDKIKNKVKLNILKLLYDKYGIIEEDFISAELEVVPAIKAKDVGFDRSMVGAYGQDDRVCAYTSLKAILEMEALEKTAICVMFDKEETGSAGVTGAQSVFLENFLAYLCAYSTDNYNDIMLRRCISASKMLSADVNPAVDANYEGVQDKRNASYLGKGLVICKYAGARGKVGTNDANAEFLGEFRKLMNENNILWQTAEFGKGDQGGGGTIAEELANKGIEVLDCGVALLSMHSPFEITSKIDIYINFEAYKLFYMKG